MVAWEMQFGSAAALAVVGVAAGLINTLAGGGSLLTLPVLLLFGLSPHAANATNRVAIVIQSFAGSAFFDQAGRLDRAAASSVIVPTLLGALAGALLAAWLPAPWLRAGMLAVTSGLAALLLLRPGILAPHPGEGRLRTPTASTRLALLAVGFYGGLLQAGVGLLMLAVLCGRLRYDLVAANALKSLAIGFFTLLALVVFALAGQVLWLPGIVLSAGMVAGARLAVTFSLRSPPEFLRRVVLLLVLLSCAGAWLGESGFVWLTSRW